MTQRQKENEEAVQVMDDGVNPANGKLQTPEPAVPWCNQRQLFSKALVRPSLHNKRLFKHHGPCPRLQGLIQNDQPPTHPLTGATRQRQSCCSRHSAGSARGPGAAAVGQRGREKGSAGLPIRAQEAQLSPSALHPGGLSSRPSRCPTLHPAPHTGIKPAQTSGEAAAGA